MFEHHNFKLKISSLWDFLTSKTGAFIIGVSAIVIGSYQFYINKPIMEYQAETVNFVSSANENDYKINVHGKDYKDLYQTQITLTNKGEQALAGRDVSKIGHDPFRIVIPNDAKVVHYTIDNNLTSESITPNLLKNDEGIVLTFDFINPDNQIVVNLLHETPAPEFKMKGSALNVDSIQRAWNERQIRNWGLGILGLLYAVLLVVYVYRHTKVRYRKRKK